MRGTSPNGRNRILLALALALLLCAVIWRLDTWEESKARASAALVPVEEADDPGPPGEHGAEEPTEPPDPIGSEALPHDSGGRQAASRGPAVLLVRVFDAHDRPAQGALVRVHSLHRSRPVPGEPLAAGTSDAAGVSRFDAASGDDVRIQAERAREVGSIQVALRAGPNEVLLRMEGALPVAGTVLDTAGRPVAGADVLLSLAGPIRGAESAAAAFHGVTDTDGRVPIPDRQVDARPYYQVVAPGFRTAYGELERQSMLQDGFEVRLEPLATVTGRFLDREGRGVAGVNVLVSETMAQAVSELDGRFELPGLPEGGGTLVVEPRRHGRLILRGVRPARGSIDLADIVLGPGLDISGKVVDPGGAPLPGVNVWTRCEETGFPANVAQTNGEGRFIVTGLCEGSYLVTASGDARVQSGKTGPSAAVPGVAAGTENLELVFRPHPALTIELVSAETGAEAWVLKLEVWATLHGTAQTVSQTLESPRRRRLKNTTLVLEAQGEYDVSVLAPGCPEQRLQVTLGPEEWKTVTVRLPRVE